MPTARTTVGTSAVAVVGAGAWGWHLARHFHRLGALAAICDLSEAVARASARDYPQAWFTPSYTEALAAPAVRAVALATPAATHFEMAKAALEADKDVFVEKPLALDAHDGETLVRLARSRNRILMVGHVLRYHPAVIALQELVGSGALGKIYYMYSNRLNIGTIRTEENILWSFAPHDVSVMLALLGESPDRVTCQGGAYLDKALSDVTLSQFEFASGVQAHIFVSWLHPIKEQRLVVVGSEQMAVFDDLSKHKLVLYPHKVAWRNRVPTAIKGEGRAVTVGRTEPLALECRHFLECVTDRVRPRTDGEEGLEVLRVLDACQRSLFRRAAVSMTSEATSRESGIFVHESACVDRGASVGAGTKIWHFAHVMAGARIGERCVLGQNVHVSGDAVVGHNVKVQNNVSIYSGVVIEDDVFLGPSCVLTNVTNPRAQVNRHSLYERTLLRRGCTVGANATIVCGTTIGRYAFVGAGAVVTKDVPDYALVIGNPARRVGWMSRHGHRLGEPDLDGLRHCPESGYRYRQRPEGGLQCVDLDEEAPLPKRLRYGSKPYRAFAATDGAERP